MNIGDSYKNVPKGTYDSGFCTAKTKKVSLSKNNTSAMKPALKCDTVEISSKKEEKCGFLYDIKKIFKKPAKQETSKPKEESTHIFAYDGCTGNALLRDDMRTRILTATNLNDDNLQIQNMDKPAKGTSQLHKSSKYYSLGKSRFNEKRQEYIYICENLKDMPDFNGVRGKNPLYGKRNIGGLKFRLAKIKESGINTIIDLRTEGECPVKSKEILKNLGMNYVNFPVEDLNWDIESVKKIGSFIKAVNEGDFYMGCANGQARTDLAVSINYVLNPKAKNVPELYFGNSSTSRVSVKQNIGDILNIISKNPDIVKEWGWASYEDFIQNADKKFKILIAKIQNL